jgi:cation diffusion facilitator family transporter
MRVGTYLKLSALVAVATIFLKAWAWRLTGSVSLLSDALETIVNLAGALFALGMVTWAAQPADEEHPYGHHKAEYFSSGFEGMLIVIAAVGIVVAAMQRFAQPQAIESIGVGLALSIAASVLNAVLATAMLRDARRLRSIALEADARHLIADVWTSGGVVVGLVGVHFTGWLWLDPAVALAVAANILREGTHLLARSADGLMDRALEADVQRQIAAALDRFRGEEARFDHVVTRRAGQRRFIDMHMHLPAGWTLGRAAGLRARVEEALMAAVPGLRATIQLLPTDVEAHVEDLPPASAAPVTSTALADPAAAPAGAQAHSHGGVAKSEAQAGAPVASAATSPAVPDAPRDEPPSRPASSPAAPGARP